MYKYIYTHTDITGSKAYPLFCTIKYSTGSSKGEIWERKFRVGVICESDLPRLVFIDIACSNAVGKLA
jgi:hypothetical protein